MVRKPNIFNKNKSYIFILIQREFVLRDQQTTLFQPTFMVFQDFCVDYEVNLHIKKGSLKYGLTKGDGLLHVV